MFMNEKTPRELALGYGWVCPYCRIPKDEGQRTGVYYFREAVCSDCAPILQATRNAERAQRLNDPK